MLLIKSKFHGFAGVQGASAGFEDGGGFAGALDGGEVFAFAEDEVGDALVAVAGLTGEVAVGIGGVAEEERVGALVTGGVGGVVVTPMGLVDADFAFVMEGEEALLGVDLGFGGDPGGSVNCGGAGAGVVFPVDHEGDGVFGGEVHSFGDAIGGGSGDGDGAGEALKGPAVEVDVVGVEVVGDVGGFSGPGTKAFELGLRLAHIADEVRGISELAEFFAGVGIDGIPALVNFHGDGNVFLVGDFDEGIVLGEGFDDGLGDEDVKSA